jgi:predicted transcriptional regulator
MERLCDLLFEVSNEVRLTILQHLEEGPSNISKLSKELDISNQECSRHVSRLVDAELVERDSEGQYRLTEYGGLFMKQLLGQMFTSANREYFNGHSLAQVPYEFVARLGELKGSLHVEDVMAVFQNIQEMCDEAEEYLWRLTDKHLNIIYTNLQAAADRGVECRRIEPEVIVESPHVERMPLVNPCEVRGMENVDVFMAISEKEVAALAFPEVTGGFDYLGFTSRDEKTLKWCTELFQYYWDQAKPKIY